MNAYIVIAVVVVVTLSVFTGGRQYQKKVFSRDAQTLAYYKEHSSENREMSKVSATMSFAHLMVENAGMP